jgi:chemotaxis protein MotB
MKNQPVIIIKKAAHARHGHHGGAWKVAYADFVTAMMAFFLVMWIVGQSPQVKASVAGYFRDPGAFDQQRSAGLLPGASAGVSTSEVAPPQDIEAAKATLERVAAQLREAIQSIPKFAALGDRLQIHVTEEGLLIELLETNNESFFDSGSSHLREDTVALLEVIGKELSALTNKVAIEGHTDSHPYSAPNGYTNWELSADRANAARRVMQPGLNPTQMEAVRGYADQHLRYPDNPLDPRNRRISIVVRR